MPDRNKNSQLAPGFFFVELEAGESSEPFDGLTSGEFIDMYGRELVIDEDDLEKYVNNTKEVIESSKTPKGEIVGIPIDAMGHDHGDGAGWIVGVELQDKVIRFTPKWTDVGMELIERGIRRFFSSTIDIKHKVVLGGSLTNWPAVRANNGKILLRPIELSDGRTLGNTIGSFLEEGQFFKDKKGGIMPTDEKDNSKTQPATPINLAELVGKNPELANEVNELAEGIAQNIVKAELAKQERTLNIKRTAEELIADSEGTGLPATVDELQAILEPLDDENYQKVVDMFTKIKDSKAMDYREFGHSKHVEGKTEVPEAIKVHLHSWVEAGRSLESFFKENASELGAMSDYNLAEFRIKEE